VFSLAYATSTGPQPFDHARRGRDLGNVAAGRRHGRRVVPGKRA
jgi:hypothetical protein